MPPSPYQTYNVSANGVSLLWIPQNSVPALNGGASFCIKMSLCWSEVQHLCRMNPSSSPRFECWAGPHLLWDIPWVSGSQLSWLHPPQFLVHPQPSHWWGEIQKMPWFCLSAAQQQQNHPCVINTVFSTNPRHSSMQLLWRKFTLSQPNPAHCSGLTATDITPEAALWPHLFKCWIKGYTKYCK